MDQAALRLEKSELYTNDFRQRIFLCKTQAEYSFFSGPSFKSLAINHPFTNNIFISKPSLKKDSMFKTRGIKTQRSINSVIAHETTHTLLNHKLGTMYARFKLPKWKNEGYCELIGQESTMNDEEGWKLFCNEKRDEAPQEYYYFLYRKRTEESLFNNKQPLMEWLYHNTDKEALIEEIREIKCSKDQTVRK